MFIFSLHFLSAVLSTQEFHFENEKFQMFSLTGPFPMNVGRSRHWFALPLCEAQWFQLYFFENTNSTILKPCPHVVD